MLLPGALFARAMAPQLWHNSKKTPWHWLYLFIGVLWLEYAGGIAAYWFLFELNPQDFPKVLINPMFNLVWIGAVVLGDVFLFQSSVDSAPSQSLEVIEFVSDRRHIRLERSQLAYIESRSSYTVVHTSNGTDLPVQRRIGQWESLLPELVRVHRSFLVNGDYVRSYSTKEVGLLLTSDWVYLPISRTYKDAVALFIAQKKPSLS